MDSRRGGKIHSFVRVFGWRVFILYFWFDCRKNRGLKEVLQLVRRRLVVVFIGRKIVNVRVQSPRRWVHARIEL